MGDYTVIFYLFLFLCIIGIIKSIKRTQNENSFGVNYLGGLSGVVAPKSMVLKLEADKISIGDIFSDRNIYFKDMISFDIKSEIQISKDVTLTRMLTLGIFAFAFKKEKTKVNNYFIIKFKEEDEEKAVVLQTPFLENMYNDIKHEYNRYKNKIVVETAN